MGIGTSSGFPPPVPAQLVLTVAETVGVARTGEIVRSGIPLPLSRGLRGTASLTLVDAGGKPVSPEMLLEMIDTVQMEFGPDGQPRHSFVIHPDMLPAVKKIADQMENDPELKRRHAEILERQREAWAARESNRKLVD
jgi:hypothetical protein